MIEIKITCSRSVCASREYQAYDIMENIRKKLISRDWIIDGENEFCCERCKNKFSENKNNKFSENTENLINAFFDDAFFGEL